MNSGVLLIEGTLENRGEMENKGNIIISSSGKIKNYGIINSICENFEERGINEDMNIVGQVK